MAASVSPVPSTVQLEGHLEQPSRWLWLVKWLLLVPHYVVLALLWLAFALLSVVAFVVLLFGGSYPRGIFEFNSGVLRWTWRVAFYAFAANGTDRYPPFTLADVPEYPAHVEIAYPADQRHGLPLIGWWLAGIPQYCVAAIFAGSGTAAGWEAHSNGWSAAPPFGLVGLLVFFGAVYLLFRGTFPRSIFDLVLGLNRWVIRVGAYAALMTREYPPFRLDVGEREPALAVAPPAAESGAVSRAAPSGEATSWGFGRVLAVVLGSLVLLTSLGFLAAGATALVFDKTQRDAGGFLMAGSTTYSTQTHALVSGSYRTGVSHDWFVSRDILGKVRIRVQSAQPVFVGIGPAVAVESYLGGVSREVATRFDASRSDFRVSPGGAPTTPPAAQQFWVARAAGAGTQTLTWKPADGRWRVVLMNRDGSAGVRADIAIGARFPNLGWIGGGVLGAGVGLLLIGGGILVPALRRR